MFCRWCLIVKDIVQMKLTIPGLSACLLIGMAVSVVALDTLSGPYKKIAARNVFGLNPIPPPPQVVDIRLPPPKILLQGIDTICGRKQVLFKLSIPARPPNQASEASKVMSEGDRDGDIEVLAIDVARQEVRFRNNGEEETRTMKDDAAKPSSGGMSPMVMPGQIGAVPIPPLAPPASQVASDAATRRTPEETAILFQANKMKNDQLRASGVNIPKMPDHPLLRNQLNQGNTGTTGGQ